MAVPQVSGAVVIEELLPYEQLEALWPKQVLDFCLSALLLTLLALPMAIVAFLIKLDSRGPVLFGQRRIGLGGEEFTLYKFRSMRQGNDQAVHLRQSARWFEGTPGAEGFKPVRDPRITRLGGLLRKTSVDELPQLINVLKGEMSLVGPRPLMPYDRPMYKDWYFERERMTPGITGLWHVSGRDRLSAETMMRLDARYVRTWSMGLDLKIIFLTVPALLGR